MSQIRTRAVEIGYVAGDKIRMNRVFPILDRITPLLCALWLVSEPLESLAIEVRIRARTQLTMDVTLHRDGLRVEGVLQDTSGRPVPNADVNVGAQGSADHLTATDGDGVFVIDIPSEEIDAQNGSLQLRAEYAGDSRYGGAQFERLVDVRKREVVLSISPTTNPIPLLGPPARFFVETYSSGAPISGLSIVVEPHGLTRVQVTTGKEGTAVLEIPAENFPLAGEYPVVAVFEGTAAYNPTSAETKLTVVAESTVTLSTKTTDADRVVLEGAVTVGEKPKPDAIVVLETANSGITRAVSDADGRFQFDLVESAVPDELKLQSRLRVRASYLPSEPWISAAISPEVVCPLPGNSPIPLGPLLWPVVGLFAIGGAYRAFRSAVPRRFWEWLRALPQRAGKLQSESGLPRPTVAVGPVGRTFSNVVKGMVIDTLVDTPVPGATVYLNEPNRQDGEVGIRRTTTTDTGVFWFESTNQRGGTLQVQAEGYLSASVVIDRRSADSPIEVRIFATPLRAELLEIYQSFVDEYWSESKPWGHLTPRETQKELLSRIRHEHASVREVVTLFELGYFSKIALTPDVAARLRALVRQIRDRNPEGGR